MLQNFRAFKFSFRPGFVVSRAVGQLQGEVIVEGRAARLLVRQDFFLVANFAGDAFGVEGGLLIGERCLGAFRSLEV
jgi:hypothetical protein